jgi:heme-degrading monooxygenase HmoA
MADESGGNMFINRNEVEVTLGRSSQFEATIDEWAAVQSQNAGFVGATLLQSCANPGRYLLTSRWTDREASIAAGRREQFTAFAASSLTSGLARATRLTESYESVFEVDQEGVNPAEEIAERWIDFSLNSPFVAPQFEQSMRQLAEVIKQHAPGFGSARLRRSAGKDTRYLLLLIMQDREAARGWLLVPEVRAVAESGGTRQYLAGEPEAEIYSVVKRYTGPGFTAAQTTTVAVAGARELLRP